MAQITQIGQLTFQDTDRYDPGLLPALEDHVNNQIAGNTYDLEANLAVLKLYQFYPERINLDIVKKILIKALMNLQAGFSIFLFMMSERLQNQEDIARIVALSNYLETCQFKKFWQEYDNNKASFNDINGFEAGVREFIIGVLSITYRTVDKQTVMECLRVTDAELTKITEEKSWQLTDDGYVIVPPNEYNQALPKITKKPNLKFNDVAKVLSS